MLSNLVPVALTCFALSLIACLTFPWAIYPAIAAFMIVVIGFLQYLLELAGGHRPVLHLQRRRKL